MEEIKIRDEFIKLGQLLKLASMVEDGVEAKYVITDGLVKVNGEECNEVRYSEKKYYETPLCLEKKFCIFASVNF